MHVTYKDEVWLWRGEADASFTLEPGMHTRVRKATGAKGNEQQRTVQATSDLMELARSAGLDWSPGERQQRDLELLAHLQHFGAATPLLDVSVDPLIAFWMATWADADDPNGADKMDDRDGRILGILRPPAPRVLLPDEQRDFHELAALSTRGYLWYRPPYVAERLRIQRGSFLIGAYSSRAQETTLNLDLGTPDSDFLTKRINAMGTRGKPPQRTAEVICFPLPKAVKPYLRELLVSRSGLDPETVYPVPWNDQPIKSFARGFGRMRPL